MTDKNDFALDRRTVMKLGAGVAVVAGAGVNLAPGAFAAEPAAAKMPALGSGLSRAEGPLKVSGQARYAIEQKLENMAYGVTVQSTRPAGRIVNIDTSAAKAVPDVIDVYTHQNTLKINKPTVYSKGGGATEEFTPIQDDVVRFNGMHIALVVAETFEAATEAAGLERHGAMRRRGWPAAMSRSMSPIRPRGNTTCRWSRMRPSPPGIMARSPFGSPASGLVAPEASWRNSWASI